MKMAELKDELTRRGLDASGFKHQLIARLEALPLLHPAYVSTHFPLTWRRRGSGHERVCGAVRRGCGEGERALTHEGRSRDGGR